MKHAVSPSSSTKQFAVCHTRHHAGRQIGIAIVTIRVSTITLTAVLQSKNSVIGAGRSTCDWCVSVACIVFKITLIWFITKTPHRLGRERFHSVDAISSRQTTPPTITGSTTTCGAFIVQCYSIVPKLIATATLYTIWTLLEPKEKEFFAYFTTGGRKSAIICCNFKEPTEVTESSLTVLVTADVAIGLGGMEHKCVVVLIVQKVDRTKFFSLPYILILGKGARNHINCLCFTLLSVRECFY